MRLRRWKKAAAGVLAAAAALGGAGWWLLPKPELLERYDWSRVVRDREGGILCVTLTRDDKYRVFTPLDAIAPEMIHATLTQEDRFFARHPGVNAVPLARSAWAFAWHGRAHAGASTISMQVARLRWRLHTRTLPGKAVQIFRALQLERHYTKAQILEAYFNLAPYGRNLEGAGAASLLCFGKPASRLTLPEAVALSVIPQSPTRRALRRGAENPALTGPQNRLLERLGAPSEAHAFRAQALARPALFAPHYARQALREASRGAPEQREIATTLDPGTQRILERGIRSYLDVRRREGIANAAALLVNTRTMAVEAQVGSADFSDTAIQGQVDGTRRPRSPGSTLKPFVYALALEQGLIHPLSLLEDAPRRFGAYDPENFDRGFAGPLRACDALARSRNIPAVALAARLGHPDLYEFLQLASVRLPRGEAGYGLTLPLGGAEVTMQDLARLYGTLANDGKLRPLRWLAPAGEQAGACVLSPEAAFLTLEMLGPPGNPPPDGSENGPVFWKTGTSNGFRDAWTVALCGDHLLLVWIGNFNGRANPAFVGGTCAAPLAFQLLGALRAEGRVVPAPHLPPPGANLRRVDFCAVSGQLPTADCKERVGGWFIPGTSPIALCSVHREVLVDAKSGLRVPVDDGTRALRREVYEFWPSHLLALFAEAGLPRRTPPPFLPGSSGGEGAVALPGKPVHVVSPRAGVVYALRTGEEQRRGVPLQAECDGDVAQVYWFAEKVFLGVSRAREPFIWHPAPGAWTVTAVDDHGRSDGVRVTIQAVEAQ